MENIKNVGHETNKEEWDMKVEPFDVDRAAELKAFEEQKREALEKGVEPYSANKAAEYYWPDDMASSEAEVMDKLKNLERDYYESGAETIEAWATEREAYDRNKDD